MQRSALYRSRRELYNAYFLAKFGLDTAENETCQVCPTEQCSRCRTSSPTRRARRRTRARRLRSEVNIELNFPPKLRGARSRLYRRRFLQVNTRWKALAEIYTMHSFAPFWNRIPKNEENHGGEKILVKSRENRPGEAHRQLHLSTQCYPRARSRITAV